MELLRKFQPELYYQLVHIPVNGDTKHFLTVLCILSDKMCYKVIVLAWTTVKKPKTSFVFGLGAVMAQTGWQGETHRCSTFIEFKPMTPRDRVPLSECCFISPNFSLLFRIITNKKLRPVVEAA